MLCAPLLHPLYVLGTAEVIPVFGFGQPALLTGAFADGLALDGGTIFLAPAIAVIGDKELLTMQTFAASGRRVHRVETLPD